MRLQAFVTSDYMLRAIIVLSFIYFSYLVAVLYIVVGLVVVVLILSMSSSSSYSFNKKLTCATKYVCSLSVSLFFL